MNKDYFLRELEYLLMDLSEEERESALEYYRDYFEEAGEAREAEMAARLGSPAKVAAELKAGLEGDTEAGEFSERGYRDERFSEEKIPDYYTEVVAGEVIDEEDSFSGKRRHFDKTVFEKHQRRKEHHVHENRGGGILLLILFLVFGLPLAGTIIGAGASVVAALVGIVVGIFGGLFGLIIGGISLVFGLFAAGAGTIIAGISNLATPAIGIMTIGFGFFMIAGAFLMALFVKWACGAAVPGLIRMCVELVRKAVGLIKRLIGRMFGRGGNAG